MYSNAKRRWCLLLSISAISLWLSMQGPAWATGVESRLTQNKTTPTTEGATKTESPSDRSSEKSPAGPNKLDQVGEKVGNQVDDITRKASSRFGKWIGTEALYGITWLKLIACFVLLFIVLLIERVVRLAVERRKKAIQDEKDVKPIRHLILESIARPLSLFIWVYGIYLVSTPLFLHFRKPDGTNLVHTVAREAAEIGAAVAIVWFIFKLVSIVDFKLKNWAASTDSAIDDVLAPLAGRTLRVFIIIIGGILIIQNLTGVKIGPLLASLGIGGIAVALAAKDSIANLFGTLTILFDKPFQLGDRITIDKFDGVVEDVGFRSTRIRTLTGHLVTIPNEKVVSSGVENIAKRPHIRWLTNITITYDTAPDRVEKAVTIIKEILDDHEGLHPDFPPRVYFNGFNDWSLNIMVVVWYHPADYWAMQEWQQQTCLEILRRFTDEGIDFAFPSRTVYLANDDKRQLKLKMLAGETVTYTPEGNGHE
ncbi:MAG: mechanosensitive ion channel family protein [Deltaproteobacteria bacterium]|nr:mechanosensitive ion channel family protein [Deltaproteobacteria bacterium]